MQFNLTILFDNKYHLVIRRCFKYKFAWNFIDVFMYATIRLIISINKWNQLKLIIKENVDDFVNLKLLSME